MGIFNNGSELAWFKSFIYLEACVYMVTATDDRFRSECSSSLFQLPVFVIGAYGLWRGKAAPPFNLFRGAAIVTHVRFQTREGSTLSLFSTAPLPARRPTRALLPSWIPPSRPPQPSRKISSLSPPRSAPCSSPAMCHFSSSRYSWRWIWRYGCRNWHLWAFARSMAQRLEQRIFSYSYPSLSSSTLS